MEFKRNLEEVRQENREPETFFLEPTKQAVNELLFTIMPPTATLREVEDLAVAIVTTVNDAWNDYLSKAHSLPLR